MRRAAVALGMQSLACGPVGNDPAYPIWHAWWVGKCAPKIKEITRALMYDAAACEKFLLGIDEHGTTVW